jgi:hypothetical protein
MCSPTVFVGYTIADGSTPSADRLTEEERWTSSRT